jgi:pimeloyl-ACP methyl ester carboxylesterase
MNLPAPARRSLVAFMVGMALLTVAACSSSEEPERSSDSSGSSAEGSSAPTSQTTTTAVPSVPSGAFRDVEFRALDGELRSGRLFGEGPVGVVLSHMGRPGDTQDDWAPFAAELADHGHQVLTYDRRSDLGEVWQDVLGAATHLRDNGAERVVAGGASIGAMASLHAAGQPASNLDGVIWLAGVLRGRYSFAESDVSGLGCPMLFMSGDRDAYGAAAAARRLAEWVTAPSELLIVESERHGTDILEEGGPAATELRRSILAFVDQVDDEPSTC